VVGVLAGALFVFCFFGCWVWVCFWWGWFVLFGFGLFCFWGLFFVFFWFVGVFGAGLILNCRMSVTWFSEMVFLEVVYTIILNNYI
jgi:hypothetical protein